MKPSIVILCIVHLILVSCRAQVPGCTDPLANNYNPSSNFNDGSCTYYPISVSPINTMELSESLKGTSGLIMWDGYVWTHNDHEDTKLYGLDTVHADISREYQLQGVENTDWEEISQDDEYIYIGDFGNNLSGNRTDLHILRVEKGSLKVENPVIDTIWFSYSDQVDFNSSEANENDFDCEAFIVSDDSIYLFTKQWISKKTTVYSLPKTPGTFAAKENSTFNIQGLITGATYIESRQLLVLCGYTSLLHPFLYLLYDFSGHHFFSGNKRRITVSLPFHQVEGISTRDGLKYYLTNEQFILQPAANSPQKFHIFYLGEFLEEYIDFLENTDTIERDIVGVYPNPTSEYITIHIRDALVNIPYQIVDQLARVVHTGFLIYEESLIDISHLSPGYYSIHFSIKDKPNLNFVKL